MNYTDTVWSIGQPEIWYCFNPDDGADGLDGLGIGDRGDLPLRTYGGSSAFVRKGGEYSIPGDVYGGCWDVTATGLYAVSGQGSYSFAHFATSTYCVWVRNPAANVAFLTWGANSTTAGSGAWRLKHDNGSVVLQTASSASMASASANLTDGNWHFLAYQNGGVGGASSSSNHRLWIDGNLAATGTRAMNANVSGYLTLGDRFSSAGRHMMQVAHPMHYPGGLTDTQIQTLWQAGSPPPVTTFRGWGIPPV